MTPDKSLPDFTGEWEMNFEKSVTRGPAPKRMLMRIDHWEPRLIQKIRFRGTAGRSSA